MVCALYPKNYSIPVHNKLYLYKHQCNIKRAFPGKHVIFICEKITVAMVKYKNAAFDAFREMN